jgi:hypothetical protein
VDLTPKIDTSLIPTPTYTDSTIASGQTCYYVTTEVDASGAESAYSTQTSAMMAEGNSLSLPRHGFRSAVRFLGYDPHARFAGAGISCDLPVPPLAHQHFALVRGVISTVPLQLEKVVVTAHRPVVVDHARALQTENAVQLRSSRRTSMMVFQPCCHPRKSPVVLCTTAAKSSTLDKRYEAPVGYGLYGVVIKAAKKW